MKKIITLILILCVSMPAHAFLSIPKIEWKFGSNSRSEQQATILCMLGVGCAISGLMMFNKKKQTRAGEIGHNVIGTSYIVAGTLVALFSNDLITIKDKIVKDFTQGWL